MKKAKKYESSNMTHNNSEIGETIEEKVMRISVNKEPITDGAPIIYTERKNGVQAGYNIRTDRFEVATEAMDKVHRSQIAKSEEMGKVIPINKDVGDESIHDTK